MIDAHNHLHQLADPGQILADSQACGIKRMVVNGTCESDWESVETLCRQHPQTLLPSFGLHPWHVPEKSDQWLATLRALLLANPEAALGECGLDRWKRPFDLADQLHCLQLQFDLANELKRPLTIHCLQAWGPLLDFLSSQKKRPPFLVHAFSGSTEMMHQLAALGAYFSFNGYFLHERKSAVRETFQTIPLDRLLIESDAPAMLPPDDFIAHPLPKEQNHPANLAACLSPLADIRSLQSDELEAQLEHNFRQFWAHAS